MAAQPQHREAATQRHPLVRPSHVNVIRRGSGSPLLLLHGLGHHGEAWEPVIDDLAQHHDVFALDMPGFGATPMPPGARYTTMSDLTDAVEACMDELGLDTAHIAANSLGCAVAVELADRGRATTLTLISPVGFLTDRDYRAALFRLRLLWLATHVPVPLLRGFLRVPELRRIAFGPLFHQGWERFTTEMAISDALSMRRGKAFTACVRILDGYVMRTRPAVPTTLLWGTRDVLVPFRLSEKARRHLPEARFQMLEACGHVPMVDNPEGVARAMLAATGADRA